MSDTQEGTIKLNTILSVIIISFLPLFSLSFSSLLFPDQLFSLSLSTSSLPHTPSPFVPLSFRAHYSLLTYSLLVVQQAKAPCIKTRTNAYARTSPHWSAMRCYASFRSTIGFIRSRSPKCCLRPSSMAALSTLRAAAGRLLGPVITRQWSRGAGRLAREQLGRQPPSHAHSTQWLKYPAVIGPMGLAVLAGCHTNQLRVQCRASQQTPALLRRSPRDLSHDQVLQFDWWKLWELVSPDIVLLVLAVAVSERWRPLSSPLSWSLSRVLW